MATTKPKPITKPATTAKKAPAKKPAAKPAPKAAKATKPKPVDDSLSAKASAKVRDAATQGKERATGALDELSNMVEDVAKTLDEKVGAQYGDYARKAASAVSDVATSLKSKDVDDLVGDARAFVREKPAVAIGAAAALGFFLTRLFKAGSDDKA